MSDALALPPEAVVSADPGPDDAAGTLARLCHLLARRLIDIGMAAGGVELRLDGDVATAVLPVPARSAAALLAGAGPLLAGAGFARMELRAEPLVPYLFAHLPALYRAREDAADPFSALVWLAALNQAGLDARLAAAPAQFDPRTATSAFDDPRSGFLEMLAGWTALDPAMLGGEAAAGPDRRAALLRHLVLNAAPLQAARGTRAGTRYLLEVLFGAAIELREWAWPASFQPGEAATLGVDTLVMGDPPLDRCVTLVWDGVDPGAAADMAEAVSDGAEFVALQAGEGPVGSMILHGAAPAPWGQELDRLQEVLRREWPAHVARYIGIHLPQVARLDLRPFIAGIEGFTTLGHIQIQRES